MGSQRVGHDLVTEWRTARSLDLETSGQQPAKSQFTSFCSPTYIFFKREWLRWMCRVRGQRYFWQVLPVTSGVFRSYFTRADPALLASRITNHHGQKLLIVIVQSLSRVQLCDPMGCSTPGFLVVHHLPELTETHVHGVGDAIQPSRPLSSPSPPALNLSQHQGLFQWVGSLCQVAKVLEFQLQHQSFQWIFRIGFL